MNVPSSTLCEFAVRRSVLACLSVPWQLEVLEGGDHSFKVPKAMVMSPEEIYDRILDRTLKWRDE